MCVLKCAPELCLLCVCVSVLDLTAGREVKRCSLLVCPLCLSFSLESWNQRGPPPTLACPASWQWSLWSAGFRGLTLPEDQIDQLLVTPGEWASTLCQDGPNCGWHGSVLVSTAHGQHCVGQSWLAQVDAHCQLTAMMNYEWCCSSAVSLVSAEAQHTLLVVQQTCSLKNLKTSMAAFPVTAGTSNSTQALQQNEQGKQTARQSLESQFCSQL